MNEYKYLVSACLAGENCRYDGNNNKIELIKQLVEQRIAIPFCPEVEGGLPTPRIPCEIQTNNEKLKVISQQGSDCTEQFLIGAKKAIELCKQHNIRKAILKESSPSCGSTLIYDGSFSKTKKEGKGICTLALEKEGIRVYSESNFVLK